MQSAMNRVKQASNANRATAASAAAAATAAAGTSQNEEQLELVAHPAAFELAKSWLGEAARDVDWEQWRTQSAMTAAESRGRPDRLGLGAKFLSHNKAMTNMGRLQSKMQDSLVSEYIRAPPHVLSRVVNHLTRFIF